VAGVGFSGALVDRQRVHVGAEADDTIALCLALDQADDAGAADAFDDLIDTEGAQQLGDALGGAVDVVAQLGVFVEIAAPGGDLGVKVGNTVDHRHAGTLPAGCAGRQPATGCPRH
jgi:hypothetical protein